MHSRGLSISKGKRFSSSPKCHDWLWGAPSPLFSDHQFSPLEVKLLEREFDYSTPFSAEDSNEWS